jgi:hypothetical protein
MKLIAIHRIGVGLPRADGTVNYAEPGEEFELEDRAEAQRLIDRGAAREAPVDGAPERAAA